MRRREHMRKILAIFAVCLLVILPLKLSFAEEQEQHFYIQLQPMYRSVQGIDEHVGDIVKYREQWDGLTLDYRYGRDPFSKEETVAILVTQLKVNIPYHITDNLSICPSGYFRIWYNDQVATTFHPPDWGSEDFWQLAKRSLKSLGVGLTLNLRF